MRNQYDRLEINMTAQKSIFFYESPERILKVDITVDRSSPWAVFIAYAAGNINTFIDASCTIGKKEE
jgi:hypothetical protein